jgi:predicted RNA-binding Zn-ribbon protein involved in translation (DUF1610 family)
VEQLGEFFMQLAFAAPFLTALFLLLLWAGMRLEALPVSFAHLALSGIGFFFFYPLLIFTAGFVDVPLAFVIALIIAGALVLYNSKIVMGGQLAATYLVPLLIVFYGLLTGGLTSARYLGVMLAFSGVLLAGLFIWRVNQQRKLLEPAPVQDKHAGPAPVQEARSAPSPKPAERGESAERYCVHCGQRVELKFKYCPQCGEDTQAMRQCNKCGLDYAPAEDLPAFCPACGAKQK